MLGDVLEQSVLISTSLGPQLRQIGYLKRATLAVVSEQLIPAVSR